MSLFEENFQVPKKPSDYLNVSKMLDEEVKFRILTKPIRGWCDFVKEGDRTKIYRFEYEKKPKKSMVPGKELALFFAFVIWNYKEERIQVLEITQSSIQNPLLEYSRDPDFGNVWMYDLKLSKKLKPKVSYSLVPLPAKNLDPKIKEEFLAKPCSLNALFASGDPFSSEYKRYTKGFWDEDNSAPEPMEDSITADQASKLDSLIGDDEAYRANILAYMKNTYRAHSLKDLPAKHWDKVYKSIKEHCDERMKKELEDNSRSKPDALTEGEF